MGNGLRVIGSGLFPKYVIGFGLHPNPTKQQRRRQQQAAAALLCGPAGQLAGDDQDPPAAGLAAGGWPHRKGEREREKGVEREREKERGQRGSLAASPAVAQAGDDAQAAAGGLGPRTELGGRERVRESKRGEEFTVEGRRRRRRRGESGARAGEARWAPATGHRPRARFDPAPGPGTVQRGEREEFERECFRERERERNMRERE